MSYTMDSSHDSTYMSVSGLAGVEQDAAAVKAAVIKLQRIVGASADGKYGPQTHAKFVAWVRTAQPGLAATPDASLNLFVVQGALMAKGMTAGEIMSAMIGYACHTGTTNPAYKPICAALKGTAAAPERGTAASTLPAVPETWMTGAGGGSGPIVQEEGGFFEKYWWAIAVAALGIGGLVFWRMRRKPEATPVV